MGFDALGILIGLEQRFQIQIDESKFTQAVLVDHVIEMVLEELGHQGRGVPSQDLGLVRFQVCDIIARELGVEPMEVQPHLRLVEDLGMT